jgi:hypothetical protein
MKGKKSKLGFKIPAFALIVFCAIATSAFTQSLGDVNNSGSVDIVDALLVAQYYVGLNPAGFVASVADVNCSGSVDIVDALVVAQFYVGLVNQLSCGTISPTAIPTIQPTAGPSSTPGPTSAPDTVKTGNATYFYSLGAPYGGCGLPQAFLDTQNFVAVNVANTPGDYTTFRNRPIAAQYASEIGFFNNGLNCGRWVHVTIGNYCNGTNDGAMNQPFCRDGSGWTADAYNGAELDMVLADSCYDGNAWCRDDPNHLDLAQAALNLFVKNGQPVGNMFPDHWNNRQISWYFEPSPNYTGDIRVGFIISAQIWWPTIAIAHLPNGIHGVDYYDGTNWIKAQMNGDLGESFILGPTTMSGYTPGSNYRIRIYDCTDQLINNGRIYNFAFPAVCGTSCTDAFVEVTYTVE